MSTLPKNRNGSSLLPHFVVHSGYGKSSSSNISELKDSHITTFLTISSLENVKSAEEAKAVKLVEKKIIRVLKLVWTRHAKRFVDDSEVLKELVPPDSLSQFKLTGYSGISFPSWVISMDTYLPHLTMVFMDDLPNCDVLPPLGQLPNLEWLTIGGMPSIRKIDGDFYGGRKAFPKLLKFFLVDLKCLEEWNGLNKLVFPELSVLYLEGCPMLRFESRPPPGKGDLTISYSDEVLLSSWGHVSASSSATTRLYVKFCKAPLHQWSLLRHLPYLKHLEITKCSDLTCGATDFLRCISSLETLTVRECENVQLPERLGDLISLKELKVLNCDAIKTLPESIQQIACVQRLEINGCPRLVEWCKSEDNKMKLAHIKQIILDDKLYVRESEGSGGDKH